MPDIPSLTMLLKELESQPHGLIILMGKGGVGKTTLAAAIAVFQAFSRIIREADKKIVVMDTAPTGHTLLLLDATGT